MKKMRNLFRAIATNVIIFSLLQSCFIFSAYAQSDTAQTLLGVAGTLLNTAAQVQNQQINFKQQLAQQQRNAALISSLGPNCKKTDGTACYQTSGKYFPECPLPATISSMPVNVCNQTLPDPRQSAAQVTSMDGYEALGLSWVNYYDQQKNEASNASVPIGLKCLGDKKKALDSNLTEMINNLTRLQDQLNKDKETFKAESTKTLGLIADLRDELNGGADKTAATKAKPLDANFTNACSAIIGEEGMQQIASMGFINVQKNLEPTRTRAKNYNTNRASIEQEVRSDISKIQLAISNGGLQDYFDGKMAETSKYKSLVAATQKQATEFKIAQDRINKELAKLGYTPPTMDKNFSTDFADFIKVSADTFKKQYLNACVTGADQTGIAIPVSQIIASLQQKSTGNEGTAIVKYKSTLEGILNSTDPVDSKLQQIKTLENRYKDITVTYQNTNGQSIRQTPYDLYMATLDKCNAKYAQDDVNGTNNVSQKKKVERGQALLKELQVLHDNYSANLGTRVLEQVLSCNGESQKAGASCGSDKSFDYTDASFCMSHADQCANDVAACYSQTQQIVTKKQTEMKALAFSYNARAKAVLDRSNALYTAQKTAVMEMIKNVQARFPGTNFEIPQNMFVSAPLAKNETYGVDLLGDGNLSYLDELPKKIDLLKKVFQDQQKYADNEIQDYISKQAAAMETQQSRWKQFADQCKSMAESVRKDLAKYNAEGSKAQAMQDQKTGAFCAKYSEMKENPLGACNNVEKLVESLDGIQARISNEALKVTGRFRNVCNMYNNETDDNLYADCMTNMDEKGTSKEKYNQCKRIVALHDKTEVDPLRKKVKLAKLCDGDGSDKNFIENVSKYFSDADKEKLKGIDKREDLVKKKNDLDNSDFFDDILRFAKDKTKPICGQLTAISEADDVTEPSTTEEKDKAKAESDKIASDYKAAKTAYEDAAQKAKAKIADAQKVIDDKFVADKKTDKDKKEVAELSKVDQAELAALKAKSDELGTKIVNSSLAKASSKDKANLNLVLQSLVPASPTSKEKKAEALSKLGQQDTQACDAQNSTQNMLKLPSFDLDSFDKSKLGTTR